MSKRILSVLLGASLVAGVLIAATPARAQDPDPGRKFFLRTTGCPASSDNSDFLSLEDGDDPVCIFTGAGIRNEIGENVASTPATSDRETATRYWDATDGIPIVLDASKPITGEIWSSGTTPIVGVPGASAGQVIIDFTLVGTAGGNEVEIGTFVDTFNAIPASVHKTELSVEIDPSLDRATLDTFELRLWVHGASAGHGIVDTNGETSSYVSVPTGGTKVEKDKPGKKDPPGKGKKKGCKKGKGKKKGACPGKKNKKKKPGPPVLACAPYEPGEEGAEAETTVATDEHTEDAPLEITIEHGPGLGAAGPYDERSLTYNHIQVDSANPEAGLYVRYEFPAYEDHDAYLLYPSGTVAARAAGFNPIVEAPLIGDDNGMGGHSERGAEQIDGLKAADCQGWTGRFANYLGQGGEYTVKVWLGEIQNDPAADQRGLIATVFGLF